MLNVLRSQCLALLLLVTLTSGCAVVVVGAAAGSGVAFIRGKLVKNLDYSVEQVHKATLAAAKDLGYFITADELNRHSAKIAGTDDEGKKITVDVEALTEKAATVEIRFGVFGNDEKSTEFLKEIEAKLP